ncbi:hypothetical protein GCM10009557_09620 [Virgisporangium ochraceum]|uniref:Uncharacterized protein n=1 Tax=Virgisporangium ochraceum TaxID=65505 RepID=A0A8J3ZVZ9_9ACTN|nr:hypothetical protein [Virgisporangium ochraceum]GIJ71389.1 hypothetical protein Voc01_063060 [Virgisporangium ochraceum]
MSIQTVVLGIASIVLPRRHRARWREEASAVLIGVSGVRRLWYTLDTVLKVPILARQHRREQTGGQPTSLPGRQLSAVVGAALLASALAAAADLLSVLRLLRGPGPTGADVFFEVPDGLPVIGMPDPLRYLLVSGGLVALMATRSFRSAQRPGGGVQYAHSGAVLITVFVGTGPLVGWILARALYLPVVALVANVLPGVWLATVCALALRRRTGPWPLAVVGAIAGLAPIGVLVALPLVHVIAGQQPLPFLVVHGLPLVTMSTYVIWSAWAGVRLLLGRQDLLMARPPGPAGLQPDEAR